MVEEEEEDECSKWDPLCYDTVSITINGSGKAVVGGELDFKINFDWAALRAGDFWNTDLSLALSFSASGGLSGEAVFGGTITGTNDPVDELSTVSVLILDGVPINLGGCLTVIPVCAGASSGLNQDLEMESISYFAGFGEGFDLSVDIVSFEDDFFSGTPASGIKWKVPFFNKEFFTDTWNNLINP